jgi:glycosyltransferase involved in cell wall biosynthesis
MNEFPLVSIIIPAYNAAPFIGKTIESVQAQSYPNWEILIINDGSTDKTEEMIRNYLPDKRISYYQHANHGVCYTRNRGIDLAKGEYVAFLDADDYFLPDNLSRKISAMQAVKADWIFSDRLITNEEGSEFKEAEKGTNSDILNKLLLWEGEVIPGPCSNLIVKRELLEKYKIRFDQRFSTAADQDFSFQLASLSQGHYIPENLWVYREVNFSMSRNISVMEKDHIGVYKKARANKLFGNFFFMCRCFSNLYFILAGSWYRNAGNVSKAIWYAVLSFLYYPPVIFRLLKKLAR